MTPNSTGLLPGKCLFAAFTIALGSATAPVAPAQPTTDSLTVETTVTRVLETHPAQRGPAERGRCGGAQWILGARLGGRFGAA